MIAPDDRGFAYGDGVFETMRVVDGRIPLIDRHLARLASSLRRLRIPGVDVRDRVEAAASKGDGVLKLVVTRGVSGRGYAIDPGATPTVVVTASDAPPIRSPAVVRWCDLRLGEQPRLAGMKHLNRLEQVLARAEWDDPGIHEGLCRDAADRVICATAANIFAVIDGVLVTPALDRCGVAGVARDVVRESEPVVVRDMLAGELDRASEIFLSNAVRGIVPVTRLEQNTFDIGAVTRRVAARFAALGIGAAP